MPFRRMERTHFANRSAPRHDGRRQLPPVFDAFQQAVGGETRHRRQRRGLSV